jgi:hypothetical protein
MRGRRQHTRPPLPPWMQITEYVEPYQVGVTGVCKRRGPKASPFLDSFYTTAYPQITQKEY